MDSMTSVLTDKVISDAKVLSDDELNEVAGGFFPSYASIVALIGHRLPESSEQKYLHYSQAIEYHPWR
jgi:bacteriocin-like protein